MAFGSLLSGKVKKKTGSELDSDRYEWLAPDQAEPDFGFPDSDESFILSDADGTRRFSRKEDIINKEYIDTLNVDADTLDSLNSTQFLRSDVYDEKTSGNLKFSEDVKLGFGTATNGDVQFYHNGDNAYIDDVGQGGIRVRSDNYISFEKFSTGEMVARFGIDSASELFFDDNLKLKTTSTGVDVYGSLIFDSATGTYMTLDSAIITNLSSVNIVADNLSGEYLGFDSDLARTTTIDAIRGYFSAQGDLSYDSSTGTFQFDVEQVYTKENFDSDFNMAIDEAALNGTGLSYDSSTNTLSITDTGVVAGTYGTPSAFPVVTVNAQGQIDSISTLPVAAVDSTSWDNAGTLRISTVDGQNFDVDISKYNDNGTLTFGTDDDLQIFHDGNTVIRNNDESELQIAGNKIRITNAGINEFLITANADSAVALYYDASKKLETSSTGINVSGEVVGDSSTFANITRTNTSVTAGSYGSATRSILLMVTHSRQ